MKSFAVPIVRFKAYGMVLARPQRRTIYVEAPNTRRAHEQVLADNPGWEIESNFMITVENHA